MLNDIKDNEIITREDRLFDGELSSRYLARKNGNKLIGVQQYYYDAPKVHRSFLGAKIVDPKESTYFVCISDGKQNECLAVKHLGKSSCIATIESLFHAFGFKCYSIWTPKESFEKWSKRWLKKSIN